MTAKEVLSELEALGNAGTKKILTKHGAKEPFYGVKTGDLKKVQKKIKKDHILSLELFDSGVSDAMYLAGLIADKEQISKADLKKWAKGAYWYMLSEYTVPWIAADSGNGWELGLEWIESDDAKIAACGWSTLSNVASITKDEELDIKAYSQLLDRVKKELQSSPNRVRYTMNGFVIATGSYIAELTEKAMETADAIGLVSCEMGQTSCKVPAAAAYIQKIVDKGRVGKKKRMARC